MKVRMTNEKTHDEQDRAVLRVLRRSGAPMTRREIRDAMHREQTMLPVSRTETHAEYRLPDGDLLTRILSRLRKQDAVVAGERLVPTKPTATYTIGGAA